jgi:urease subunit alpha
MKQKFGRLPEGTATTTISGRVAYISKYTINPAVSQGISTYVGSILCNLLWSR